MLKRILAQAIVGVMAAGGFTANAASADSWPTRPITIIVPFAAAGSVDGSARAVADKLQHLLGQPVIIENVPGGGGGIGSLRAARASADGYTFLLANLGTLSILPHVNPAVGYDPIKDFTPVAEVGEYATVLVVNANEPYKTVGELIKAAKDNPGKINFGSSGTGASGHLSAELMASMADAEFTHVPYKGNAPAMMDLVAGRITFMFDVLLNSMPQIEAGKIRALGVSNHTGMPQLPGVPPISETLPGYEVAGWLGVVGPAGVPKPIVDKLSAEIEKITKMPDFIERYDSYGFDARHSTPEDFAERIKQTHALWGSVVQKAGIKAQ